ncbi:MAG: hypothetical protein QOF89_5854 [Acidobacteriota bacterium]|jgi:MoaA/NifB/PqqE/SkfB family radical SAM enzyme|nr:hypothetical protein [Acidobacteriota bacterium]
MEHLAKARERLEDLWIRGVDFSAGRITQARESNRMLLLDLDFTGECQLHCFYCDRTPDRFNKMPERQALTTEERKALILQAKQLGATTIEFPGAGEPMLDPGFWEILEIVHAQDLIPVVFTSGYHLDFPSVRRLYDLGASVFVKYNSTDAEVQDKIVGKQGYGEKVNRALELLLAAGFNRTSPTRMAIDMVVTPRNNDMAEIEKIFRWCRYNNVHNYIQTLIPEGLADRKSKILERERADSLIRGLQKIDEEEFGLFYEAHRPMAGGYKCHQVNVGMFVNLFGEVYDCNGLGRFLGSVRRNTLSEIWRSKYATSIRQPLQDGFCLLRERYWSGTESSGMDRKLEDYTKWERKHGSDPCVLSGLEERKPDSQEFSDPGGRRLRSEEASPEPSRQPTTKSSGLVILHDTESTL